MLGAPDSRVFEVALADDFVVVTENHGDYLKLARRVDVHSGLILLAAATGARQVDALYAAIGHIEKEAVAAGELPDVWMIDRWVASTRDSRCVHGWTFEDPPTP
jgi:cyclopropane fatty-acyl-phospholipid synthase-like methyltransferase